MASVADRVKEITAGILKIDATTIESQHHFALDLGADSVQSIELVAGFCEGFDIEMEEEEALQVATVQDATEYISKVCKEQGKSI